MSFNIVVRSFSRRLPVCAPTSCATPTLARRAPLSARRQHSVHLALPRGQWSLNHVRPFSSTSARNDDSKPAIKERIKSMLPKPGTPLKHEKVWNIPNTLTFGRLAASPVIGYLIVADHPTAALALFAIASVTDVIDGYIARNWNMQTVVGSVIDPMADKTLMTILTVSLAIKGALPLWLAGIILGRDVGLAISAIWFRWISLPPPKTMARYWDFSLPSAEVHPTTISKVNTALQVGLIGWCMANPLIGGGEGLEMAFEAAKYTVATTTVLSGLSYVFSKNAVKILKHPQPPVVADKSKKLGGDKK